jgi:hypothetical protein
MMGIDANQVNGKRVLIWNDLSTTGLYFLSSSGSSEVVQIAVELAVATVDHSDIRGSEPHNRDPSGAASD